MFEEIAYSQIGPLSVVATLGIVTYFVIVLAALTAVMNKKGIHVIPMKWHSRLAITGIAFATIHGTLIILTKLGY